MIGGNPCASMRFPCEERVGFRMADLISGWLQTRFAMYHNYSTTYAGKVEILARSSPVGIGVAAFLRACLDMLATLTAIAPPLRTTGEIDQRLMHAILIMQTSPAHTPRSTPTFAYYASFAALGSLLPCSKGLWDIAVRPSRQRLAPRPSEHRLESWFDPLPGYRP